MDSQESKNKGFVGFIKNFWQKYESKIVMAAGMILVAVIAFEAGVLKGQKWQQAPLIVEKSVSGETCQIPSNTPSMGQNQSQEGQNKPEPSVSPIPSPTNQNCALVGSKNSNKYHLPTCRWAKQIKPENIVCFASAEEAAAKAYQPDKNCIK